MPDANLPPWWTPDLQLASPYVRVESLNTKLAQFVVRAGRVHATLFGMPLVITSGNDGQHVPGSAHYKDGAVDLRNHDIDSAAQACFALVLITLGERSGVVVFDERATKSPHWHCEDADLAGG